MTLAALCAAAALVAADTAPDDQAEAVRLARAGAHQEALARFRDRVRREPGDLESRIWIGQLLSWTGRSADAERVFTAVLDEAPGAVDALVGLGVLLDREGRGGEALVLLRRAEQLDPDRADVLWALGRLHRRAGRTTAALAYYRRASVLAPGDADLRRDLETARRQHAHQLASTFVYERFPPGMAAGRIGALDLDLRAGDRVRLTLHQQVQTRFDTAESRTGAGVAWRVARSTVVSGDLAVAPGAAVLPRTAAGFGVERGGRRFDLGGVVRLARFEAATVWMAAPAITVPVGERLAISGRYVLAATAFEAHGAAVVTHSPAVSLRARLHPRLWLTGGYARGHERTENLSLDRIGRYRADTVSGGLRVDTPTLASLVVAAEHERGQARSVWRLTAGVAQRF